MMFILVHFFYGDDNILSRFLRPIPPLRLSNTHEINNNIINCHHLLLFLFFFFCFISFAISVTNLSGSKFAIKMLLQMAPPFFFIDSL